MGSGGYKGRRRKEKKRWGRRGKGEGEIGEEEIREKDRSKSRRWEKMGRRSGQDGGLGDVEENGKMVL